MSAPLIRDGNLSLRLLREDDMPRILSWRREPHVRAFWDNDDESEIDESFLDLNYRTLLDPASPTTGTIIEVDGAPVGFLQFYFWSSYPEGALAKSMPTDPGACGLDLFVGDPSWIGRGIGTRAVALACRHLFEARGASRVALATAIDNVAAQRAYEKAGFARVREVLDTDTRGGERIRSWLMVREP